MDGNYPSVADIAAVTGRNNGGYGGFGNGDWGAWIIFFLLFGLVGRGGYGGGFGGFGSGGNCGVSPCATQADVRAAVDQQTLISKLDQQTYGLADSTYALNNTITGGFNTVSSQLAKCCCDIERGIDGVNFNMAQNTCALQNTMNTNTRDIIDNANCNTRAILDFLTKDKIDTLTAENQALKFQASQARQNDFITANQEAQTAELIRRLGRDNPIPAYVVPNPNCCYGNPVGVSFSSGCGCSSGFGYGYNGVA